MPIRRITSIALALFAVVFVAANLVALPFANFSSYSALWAQVYGTSTNTVSCGESFNRLSDPDALKVETPFPLPVADAQMEAVYYTSCFTAHEIALADFSTDALTCSNYVVYRITNQGTLELWPTTCSPDGKSIVVPGIGLPGNLILYKTSNPGGAPQGVTLSHGA